MNITYENLTYYDSKIKEYIGVVDEKANASIKHIESFGSQEIAFSETGVAEQLTYSIPVAKYYDYLIEEEAEPKVLINNIEISKSNYNYTITEEKILEITFTSEVIINDDDNIKILFFCKEQYLEVEYNNGDINNVLLFNYATEEDIDALFE